MREVDSIKVADLVTVAWDNILEEGATPAMGYMMTPDYKPGYAYKYYNIRSRHLRVQEIFFVAYDGEDDAEVKGVLSFSEFDNSKAYIKLVALEEALTKGEDVAWLVSDAVKCLQQFKHLLSVRVLVATLGVSGGFVGPHVSPVFLKALDAAGFKKTLRLDNEGGRDVNFDVYELALASA
jgi:hypothetical protein